MAMTKKQLKRELQEARDKRDHWYSQYVLACGKVTAISHLISGATEARLALTKALLPFSNDKATFGE